MRIIPVLNFCILCLFTGSLQAQIVNIEEQRITGTNDSTRWYGYLRGSAALTKVRAQSLQLSGQTKIEFKQDPHLTLLLLNLRLIRAGDNDFARQAFAHLRYNYKIRKAWTWEAYTQLQTSPLQLLQRRWLAQACGGGYSNPVTVDSVYTSIPPGFGKTTCFQTIMGSSIGTDPAITSQVLSGLGNKQYSLERLTGDPSGRA